MKTTKIKIKKNLFGIKEIALNGNDVELTGKKRNWENFCN